MIVHRIVRFPYCVWTMRVGQSQHHTEGLILISFQYLQRTVHQPVSGEALFVGITQIISWLVILSGSNTRAIFCHLKVFPVSPVEHETVIRKTKFAGWCPSRLGIPIQMPLPKIRCCVTPLAENFRKGNNRIFKRQIIAR